MWILGVSHQIKTVGPVALHALYLQGDFYTHNNGAFSMLEFLAGSATNRGLDTFLKSEHGHALNPFQFFRYPEKLQDLVDQ